MKSSGLTVSLTIFLFAVCADAQTERLNNCAKMILITGRYWPCVIWLPVNVTRRSTKMTSTVLPMEWTAPTTTDTIETPPPEIITTTDEIIMTSTDFQRERGANGSISTTQRTSTTTTIPTTEQESSSISFSTTDPNSSVEITEPTEEEYTTIKPTTRKTRTKAARRITTTEATTTDYEEETESVTEESHSVSSTLSIPTTTRIRTSTTTTLTPEVEVLVVTRTPRGKKKPIVQSSSSYSSSSSEDEIGEDELDKDPMHPLSPTPPPYFVTLLTGKSQDEFYRIAKNPFLTKSELLYRIRRWAARQPKLVREAIFDIEQELLRQQMQVKKEVAAIMDALPLAFLQYTNIRDNVALTKAEEREDLEALFKALPHKCAKTLKFILLMAGSNEYSRKEEDKHKSYLTTQLYRSTLSEALGR